MVGAFSKGPQVSQTALLVQNDWLALLEETFFDIRLTKHTCVRPSLLTCFDCEQSLVRKPICTRFSLYFFFLTSNWFPAGFLQGRHTFYCFLMASFYFSGHRPFRVSRLAAARVPANLQLLHSSFWREGGHDGNLLGTPTVDTFRVKPPSQHTSNFGF